MNPARFFSQLMRSFHAFFSAISFIRKRDMMKFYAFPLLLSLLYWIGGSLLILRAVQTISTWIYSYLSLEASPTDSGFFSSGSEAWEMLKSWANGASSVAVMVVLKIIFWFLLGIFTKYVLLILLAPVLAYISEKTETKLTGRSYPLDIVQLTRDVWRGVRIAMKNMAIEIGILIILSVITIFAPLLSPITGVVGWLVGAYFYGYSMIDYISERKKMTIAESHRYVRDHAGIAMGLGLIITGAIMVPVIGFLTASIASIISAVAAVLVVYDPKEKKRSSLDENGIIKLKNEI